MQRNQSVIKYQLYQYLEAENLTKTYANNHFLKLLKSKGYCYAFALCRASMRFSGKLDWWEAAIEKIATWDGKLNSLNTAVNLPGAQKTCTLKEIFERVLHYIVFNQAVIESYPHLAFSQSQFLRPGGPFELLHDDKIFRVNRNYSAAGHFSREDLVKLLQDNETRDAIKNNICITYSLNHGCDLSYVDNKWYFYSSEYVDGKAKSFDDLSQLADEIIHELGQDICIELACVSSDLSEKNINLHPFTYYDELLKNQPENLIENDGLHIIAASLSSSDAISKLFKNLDNSFLVKLNALSSDGKNTPLMSAINWGNIEVITTLCGLGADPNKANNTGITPAILAVINGYSEVILALSTVDADFNKPDNEGNTALMHVSHLNNVDHIYEVINALYKAKADLNLLRAKDGMSPCMYAALRGNVKVINALCEIGVDANLYNANGRTALMIAASNGNPEIITALLKLGADPNKPHKKDNAITALYYAIHKGHIEAVKVLSEGGTNLNTLYETIDEATVLMYAAKLGQADSIPYKS